MGRGRGARHRTPAERAEQRMASVIKSVSFDATDALALATFWAAALGSDVDEDSTADKAFVEAAGWGGPNIWFNRVPEPKTAKNRMHFDLRAPGATDGRGGQAGAARGRRGAGRPEPYGDAGPGGQRVLRRARPGRVTAPTSWSGSGMPSL